jgi:DNA (cytosine-5)-methyltransferase 1
MSQREAARFQSFPDAFVFQGSKAAINRQIGNAVAPLLAYQVACQQGEPGVFVDLFAGAGGLSLGFKLAGWRPLVANDLDRASLDTYVANVHDSVVCGDIRNPSVRSELVARAKRERAAQPDSRFLVLGGPPCQGFSTAGKRRSMDDERNHLFHDYRELVDALQPDGFVFENVTGLLNMQGGRVFRDVCAVLSASMSERRWRVFVVASAEAAAPLPPARVTDYPPEAAEPRGLTTTPGADDAIGDLPPLGQGEDASNSRCSEPTSGYQEFCRGMILADEYLDRLRKGNRPPSQEQLALAA